MKLNSIDSLVNFIVINNKKKEKAKEREKEKESSPQIQSKYSEKTTSQNKFPENKTKRQR